MEKSRGKWRRRSQAFWQATVSDFENSGLSQSAFARQHDFTLSTLSRWIRKLAQPEHLELAQPQFVQVVPAQAQEPEALDVRTRLTVGHATLEFSQLPPAEFLAKLLRAVC